MKCALQGFGKLRLQKWMEKKFHIENYAWSRKTPADQDELLTKFCRGPKPPMEYFVSKNYEFRIPKIALVKKKPGQKGRPAAEYTTKRPQKHMTKKKQTRDDTDSIYRRYQDVELESGKDVFSPVRESVLNEQFQTPPTVSSKKRKRIIQQSDSDSDSPAPKMNKSEAMFHNLIMSSAPGANKNKENSGSKRGRPRRKAGLPAKLATPSMKTYGLPSTVRNSSSSEPDKASFSQAPKPTRIQDSQPNSSKALQSDNDDIDLGPYEPETLEKKLEREKRQDEKWEKWKKEHGYENRSDMKGLWRF